MGGWHRPVGDAHLASRRLGRAARERGARVSRGALPAWPGHSGAAERHQARLERPAPGTGPVAFCRDHPLSARVLVNRIWQQHFGVGIVATPDNFGLKGAPPTHPKLLDWLAVDLVEHGWTLKRLHRLIMTSAVYRQSSKRADWVSRRVARPWIRRMSCSIACPCAGSRPKRCATLSWRRAESSTARSAGRRRRWSHEPTGWCWFRRKGTRRRPCGAAFICSPGETIRSACSTFLTSRSWRSTARDGPRRRRRCNRWLPSTASLSRTVP